MKLSAIVAAALISVVSAQSSSTPIISVTAPLQGASYKAGEKAVISWINPTVDSISQIVLAKGSSNALQPVTTIASNVKADTGKYEWQIPADTPPGSDYAFEFGTSPNLAFTGQFSITGGSGGGSSNSSSSGSASGSSSASGSGSSSKPSSSGSASSSGSSSSGSSSSGSSSGSSASGSDASASASGSGADASASSAANALTAGSVAAVGAAVVAVAQLF